MLRLNQSGKDWFTITDNAGGQVSATKEELNGLYQQLIEIRDGLSSEKKDTHFIVLKEACSHEAVPMELSESAYRLLCYLQNENWLNAEAYFDKIDEIDLERFI